MLVWVIGVGICSFFCSHALIVYDHIHYLCSSFVVCLGFISCFHRSADIGARPTEPEQLIEGIPLQAQWKNVAIFRDLGRLHRM